MKNIINKAKQGFTIVELVIVIAVIGILAGVLIPTFSNVISSANEAADLNEAQNSLKAYSGYISSQGKELSDGAIFNVRDTYYVFFEGSLHKFKVYKSEKSEKEEDSNDKKKNPNHFEVLEKGPKLGIDKNEYACNARFQLIGEDGEPVKVANEEVWFYYYDGKEVTFEDGSKKVKIYAGQMLADFDVTDKKENYRNIKVKKSNTIKDLNDDAKIEVRISKDETYNLVLGENCINEETFKKIVSDEKNVICEFWCNGKEYNVSFDIDEFLLS